MSIVKIQDISDTEVNSYRDERDTEIRKIRIPSYKGKLKIKRKPTADRFDASESGSASARDGAVNRRALFSIQDQNEFQILFGKERKEMKRKGKSHYTILAIPVSV